MGSQTGSQTFSEHHGEGFEGESAGAFSVQSDCEMVAQDVTLNLKSSRQSMHRPVAEQVQ